MVIVALDERATGFYRELMSTPSRRVRVIRQHDRARYDRAVIDPILDEALVGHLGFVSDGQPYVIPTLHARVEDHLYVHGSAASRMLRALAGGVPACLTVTLIDGLVLSRSVFEHDVNYRSAVVLGRMEAVSDPEQKLRALHAFMERLMPGRWQEARPPSGQELKATKILRMHIEEASAKVRSGPPDDGDGEDGQLEVWAGHVPARVQWDAPQPAPDLRPGIAVSAAALALVRARTAMAGEPAR